MPHRVIEGASVCFLADRMLGKLSKLLRMLGHDTAWVREGSRESIAAQANMQSRVLLTRDRRLVDLVPAALFIEHVYPFHQARQVLRQFGLGGEKAFTRCVEDNQLLHKVVRQEVVNQVPPRIFESAETFWRCDLCQRIYWSGSHVDAMRETMVALLDAPLPKDDHAAHDEEDNSGALEPLLDLHQAMDALFWSHRVSLLEGNIDSALQYLRKFAMNLGNHIDLEEQLVLPIYESTPMPEGFPRGGAPDIFHRDHEKLLREVSMLERKTDELRSYEGEELSLARIELLDLEKKFVDLLSHHDHRERAYLYPRMSQILSPLEQAELLERMVPHPKT